jgi:hypothetical protein
VTFVDIENLLSIIRDISGQILSVITLFLAFISIFALLAIIALIGEMRPIEELRSRLYPLFGMTVSRLRISLSLTRVSIFVLSLIISVLT